MRGVRAPVGREPLNQRDEGGLVPPGRPDTPAREAALLELVLEGHPDDLGGVVLPVLAEED
jgi:hypothetical protein